MIPNFQGNLPQARQAGGMGGMTVSQLHPDTSYQKTFQLAAKPLENFAGNLQKMAETQFARDVKAQSDEAEAQAMQVLNAALYDPDTGYLNKRGKDAPDAYKPTLEGIRKKLSDITSHLPMPVREAVQSRIKEREMSASTTMQRWNAQQTAEWHMSSSQSRVKTLLDDGAQHYADKGYVAATRASIDQEIGYQASLAGWGEEVTAQKKKEAFDALQSGRLLVMSQDSPTAAWAELQGLRGKVSADFYARTAPGLWQRALPDLAFSLAQREGPTALDKRDWLVESLKPEHRSGDPMIDNLNSTQKMQVYSAAYAYLQKERAKETTDLSARIANSVATGSMYGADENRLSREEFVAAMGEKAGAEAYDRYDRQFNLAVALHRFKDQPIEAIQATVEAMKPRPGDPNFTENKKLYEAAYAAAAQEAAARQRDPVAAAMRTDAYGLSPITDWTSASVGQEMQMRVIQAGQIAEASGTQPKLLTEAEADSLTGNFLNMDVNGRVGTLRQIASYLDEPGALQMLAAQLGPKNREISTALFLVSGGDPALGANYLRGKDAVAQGRVKLPLVGEGSVGDFNAKLGPEDGVEGVTTNPQIQRTWAEACQGLWAYGETTEAINSEEVLERVVGHIEEFNGRKIVMPKNEAGEPYGRKSYFGKDFTDLLADKADRMKKEGGSVVTSFGRVKKKDFAPKLRSMQLESVAEGRYRVIDSSGRYVLDEDGTPYILSIFD